MQKLDRDQWHEWLDEVLNEAERTGLEPVVLQPKYRNTRIERVKQGKRKHEVVAQVLAPEVWFEPAVFAEQHQNCAQKMQAALGPVFVWTFFKPGALAPELEAAAVGQEPTQAPH